MQEHNNVPDQSDFDPVKQRTARSLTLFAVFLTLGLIYSFLCLHTSVRIPCLFRELTGLYCPGCGVTRMCVHLLHLEFVPAFRANPLVFLLTPIYLFLLTKWEIHYVCTGKTGISKKENTFVIICIVLLFIYCVLRNIF